MLAADLLARLVAPLDATGIRYMLTGGVAAIIYGEPRLTNDVDIVLEFDAAGASRIANAFSSAQYDAPPLDALIIEGKRQSGGHFNLLHLETALRADCYVAGDDPLMAWGLANRRGVEIDGGRYFLAPIEYVVLKKLAFYHDGGSDRHIRDIRHMLRLSGTVADLSFIETWVDRLDLRTEWSFALIAAVDENL